MRPRTYCWQGKLWTGILLLLVQALLPLVLHAAAPVRSHELCTAHGVKKILVVDEGEAAQQHCQLCVLAQLDGHPGPRPVVFHPQQPGVALPRIGESGRVPGSPLVLHLRGPPPA